MLTPALASSAYRRDQTPVWGPTFYDTTCTVPQLGVEVGVFDVRDTTLDLLASTYTTRAAAAALFDADPSVTSTAKLRSVLGYRGGVSYLGLEPTIYKYWGAGAPAGAKVARRAALRYQGRVVGTSATDTTARPVTLVFGGQGKIRVFLNGTAVGAGRLHEPTVNPNLTTGAGIQRDGGYLICELTVTPGDLLEVFYVHNGEPWGGLFGKVIPGTGHLATPGAALWPAFRAKLRDAGVIGASFLSKGAVAGVSLPFVEKATVQANVRAAGELTFEVALAPEGAPHGYVIETVGGVTRLRHAQDPSLVVRAGRLIDFSGGFASRPGGDEERYRRFTGKVQSITPDGDREYATVVCAGFESQMTTAFNENYPDYLGYHAAGFTDRSWQGYPVFGVAAFDAWPIQTALATMIASSGIDPANYGKSPYGLTAGTSARRRFRVTSTGGVVDGSLKFECRSPSSTAGGGDDLVYVRRPGNYGNVGPLKNGELPNDDTYLFPAKLSEKLYDVATELAGKYGYDFWFDASGQAVIGARNNPSAWQYATTPGGAGEAVHPAAIGGRFYQGVTTTGGEWTKTFTAFCSRMDLAVGLGSTDGTNGGVFRSTVERHDASGAWVAVPSASLTMTTYRQAPVSFYYDDVLRADGTNASEVTLFSLPFDEYRVTITPLGHDLADGNGTGLIRLNGVAVFERDPSTPALPAPLSTVSNLLDLKVTSNEKDLRNKVIVVGAREAAVTDSEKFAATENPNNPFTEFFVSVAADVRSIYDPEAPNFAMGTKTVVLVDDRVTDGDFAKWLARTVLYRYLAPNADIQVTHTPLPFIELRDPIRVVSAKDASLTHTTWVQSYRESWTADGDSAIDLELSAYPELASFTPREDLDVDAYFNGAPATNIRLSYLNVLGQSVSNANPATLPTVARAAQTWTNVAATTTLPSGSYFDFSFLKRINPAGLTKEGTYLVNHPYHRFTTLTGVGGSGNSRTPTLALDVQAGDGTAGVYDAVGYSIASNTHEVSYESFVTRTGLNPFYDPYTSDVGNLINVDFAPLVAGYYRVSVWAVGPRVAAGGAQGASAFDFPVAWLTQPEGASDDENAHWAYLDPSGGVTYLWDGADNIGLWNRYQSADYARAMQGTVNDEPMLVGRQFYAWNDQSTDGNTQIGDAVAANYAQDGQPEFTKGKYARFYLKIEARSDRAARKAAGGGGSAAPLYTVDTHSNRKGQLAAPAYAFTHVGEPTQVYARLEDWNPAVGNYTVGTALNGWVPSGQIDTHANAEVVAARVRGGKPVRMTFEPLPRRGILFRTEAGAADPEKTSVKLNRLAHLKLNAFDQFWTFTGKPWDGDIDAKNKADHNPSNQEAKRLTSRMHTDDTHTVEFTEDAWLTGRDLLFKQWIFQPADFQKDFGDGSESLRYGDYEQLYSLPGYDASAGGGTARSDRAYITLAYLNYIFYLSAHTLDRSGRRQWCLNPDHIDKSKIVTPAWRAATAATKPGYTNRYPRFGADTRMVRTIFARQWVEPTWKTPAGSLYYPGSPMDPAHAGTGGIGDAYQQRYVQPNYTDFDPMTGQLHGGPATDEWGTAYLNGESQVNKDFWGVLYSYGGFYHIPTLRPQAVTYKLPQLGNWGFDRDKYTGYYNPVLPRDFHPYWREPIMPDFGSYTQLVAQISQSHTTGTIKTFDNGYLPLYACPASFFASAVRDIAAQANWFGFAYSNAYQPSNQLFRGARVERDVLGWAKEGNKTDEIGAVYDYVRQDTLDRFDQYRGVFSRAPYTKRKDVAKGDQTGYYATDSDMQTGRAPVKPAGVYLQTLGNYSDYFVGPGSASQSTELDNFIHMTHFVTDWFDVRFRHEFVWESSRVFPIYYAGGAKYWAWYAEEMGFGYDVVGDKYWDAGAWTGWKDDRTDAQWTADTFLRWGELFGMDYLTGGQVVERGGTGVKRFATGTAAAPFLSGGYSIPASLGPDATSPGTTGRTLHIAYFHGVEPATSNYVRRANIFTDTYGSQRLRLAVGPRTPENRGIVLNLTLPTRLKS